MNGGLLTFDPHARPAGGRWNLACAYCPSPAGGSTATTDGPCMAPEVLEAYIRQRLQPPVASPVVITWKGGEPTLAGLDFFRRAAELVEKYRPAGTEVRQALHTNGTTLDHEWCRFFREEGFLVGVGLDGPRKLHDKYRRQGRRKPTHGKAMEALGLLNEHGIDYNVMVSVHAANAGHPLEVYRYLRDQAGARFIQFLPVVQRGEGRGRRRQGVTRASVDAVDYGAFLVAVFDEWVRRDIGRVFVQVFDAALSAWAGIPQGLCIFAPACGDSPLLDFNGDVYACSRYLEPEYRLGNILETPLAEMAASAAHQRFRRQKLESLPLACRTCRFSFACRGGCPADRFRETKAGEEHRNYLCRGYYDFFQHVEEPMQAMAGLLAEGKPPALLMQRYREE